MPNKPEAHEPDWRLVWHHVAALVNDGGWTWKEIHSASGISDGTYAKMRNHGTPLKIGAKRKALANFLGWTVDSLDTVATGGEPTEISSTIRASAGSEPTRAELLTILERLLRIAEESKGVLDLLAERRGVPPAPLRESSGPLVAPANRRRDDRP